MRSLPLLTASMLILSSTAFYGQTTSPAPQQGSGLPQAPSAATRANGASSATSPNSQPAASAQAAPAQPKTEILDSSATSGALATDGHDPILDPPPPPSGPTTLVGGTIAAVDQIRNRLIVNVFGGGKWTVFFDERTHIFRKGAETTQMALKKGERIYVDTMLDKPNHHIFARNIRLGVTQVPADADGQITSVDRKHSEITLLDSISSEPVRFQVDSNTRMVKGSEPVDWKEILPGSLVHVQFSPERPDRGLAREISIIAAPGSAFTFLGKVTYLDVHRGIIAVHNETDQRTYDIHFKPGNLQAVRNVGIGTRVKIVATFQGEEYLANSINPLVESEAQSD